MWHPSSMIASLFVPVPELPIDTKDPIKVNNHPNNTLAIAVMLAGSGFGLALDSDLSSFAHQTENFYQPLEVINPMNVTWSQPDGESTADAQYILSISNGSAVQVQAWVDYNEIDRYILEWAQDIAADPKAALVHSNSYIGLTELEDFPSRFGPDYILRCEIELAKLCARGITVVTGSGDTGAFYNQNQFNAFYPSTSAYVLTLGATMYPQQLGPADGNWPDANVTVHDVNQLCQSFNTTCLDPTPDMIEVAVETPGRGGWSGGGFSAVVDQPDWQRKAVKSFLNEGVLPSAKLFNASKRAFPDISLNGQSIPILFQGDWMIVSGTSISAPAMAAIIGILNARQLHLNRPPLGFINPLLYKMAEDHPVAFRDVTQGDNFCNFGAGYNATAGFDPVTGLGTILVPEIISYLDQIFAKRGQ
eukprot:TRINITY_DN4006_c0_g1_i2.p1 TRINITY_DN4006_c0_g1~~TRINITY_DN4006_c0_g1_i2.p1  ORF type:complete len:419 (-),score=83.02 TRINITY_DN4006_c0_g1_i2:18-1274(-)